MIQEIMSFICKLLIKLHSEVQAGEGGEKPAELSAAASR